MAGWIFPILMTSLIASAASESRITVRFDTTLYVLSYNARTFSYHQGPIHFVLPIKDCDRKVIDQITGKYAEFAKKAGKNRGETQFDVEITDAKGKTGKVPRGNPFGTWLRDLPRKMPTYNAEARVACKL